MNAPNITLVASLRAQALALRAQADTLDATADVLEQEAPVDRPLTSAELRQRLQISDDTLRRRVAEGMPRTPFGKSWRYDEAECRAWLAQRPAPGAEALNVVSLSRPRKAGAK